MNDIVSDFSKNIKFQLKKEEAIEEINTYLTADVSDEVKELAKVALDDISTITMLDELDTRISIFKTDVSVQINREAAIKELTEYIGSNYSSEVQAIYDKAVKDILNANKVEDIKEISSKAVADIDSQLAKEKEGNSVKNPLTLDNIAIYFVLLLVGGLGTFYISKRLRKVIN